MSKLLKFNKIYFSLAVLLFAIEVLIALFAHDDIIRPYVGDVFVVILIYCFVKSFFDTPVLKTALFVLLFAFAVEGLQYLNILNRLGLKESKIAATIIGSSFSWIDIVTYIIGIGFVLFFEKIVRSKAVSEHAKVP
jgi:hypothetical protein